MAEAEGKKEVYDPFSNPNVKTSLIAGAFGSLGTPFILGEINMQFTFNVMGGDMRFLGVGTSVRGVVSILAALPAATMADLGSKQRIVHIGSCIMLVVGFFQFAILYAFASQPAGVVCFVCWVFMVLNLGLWGVGQGFNGTAGALLAGSVQTGSRSQVIARNEQIGKVGLVTGTCGVIALFYFMGNEWSTPMLTTSMVVGWCLTLTAQIITLRLRDEHMLPDEGGSLYRQSGEYTGEATVKDSAPSTEPPSAGHSNEWRVLLVLLVANLCFTIGMAATDPFWGI